HSTRPNAWKMWSDNSGIGVPQTSNYIRLDSMTAVTRAAEQGLGAALVSLPMARSWFESGRLVRLFDYELVTPDNYYFVCEKNQLQRPEVIALRDWVLQSFAAK
ncbi:MAG: LysR substrate-binding domain-containing protein, partial [Woeseia sp.]